jgi:cbb3-type cytochrome oxidase subunit 3
MSKNNMHPIVNFMAALFWLFIFFIIYIIFIWDAKKETNTSKKESSISMKEAIDILDNNLSAPKKDEPTYHVQIEKRALKIIKNLKDVYNIDIVEKRERYIWNNYYQMDTADKDTSRQITISMVGHTVEVLTQQNVEDKTTYFNTCNTIFMTLLNSNNTSKTEESLFKMFSDTSKTNTRQTWKVENIEVMIKPDSTGLLGCEFYKNLRDD